MDSIFNDDKYKALHKGVEFRARAAWEVTKEVAKKTARDTVNILGEQALMGRLEKADKVGKAIKSISENPAVAGLRQTGEAADQIKKG